MGGFFMISLLMTARKDSKFMAKFIMTYLVHTRHLEEVELLIMTPRGEWNKELFAFLSKYKIPNPIILAEDNGDLGRGSSHLFYELLGKEAKGDWLWYVCDDHYLFDGYDEYISNYIKEYQLDSKKINIIVPMVSNSGRISHILSRKYFNTVGVAQHGNVDSYINNTLEYLEVFIGKEEVEKIEHFPPEPIMSDFSQDKDIMNPVNAPAQDLVYEAKKFKSQDNKNKIKEDAEKIYKAIKEEHL